MAGSTNDKNTAAKDNKAIHSVYNAVLESLHELITHY